MKLHVRSVEHLEEVIDRFTPYGQTTTSIIQSSPVPRRAARSSSPEATPRASSSISAGATAPADGLALVPLRVLDFAKTVHGLRRHDARETGPGAGRRTSEDHQLDRDRDRR